MTNVEFGALLRKSRVAAGMSRKELAGSIGKDERTVGEYENGTTDIKFSTMNAIAASLGVTVAELLTGNRRRKSIEIRVYQLDDRMNVAQILVKNGYTVSQVKRSKDGQKTVEYRLKLEEGEENLRVIRKGD